MEKFLVIAWVAAAGCSSVNGAQIDGGIRDASGGGSDASPGTKDAGAVTSGICASPQAYTTTTTATDGSKTASTIRYALVSADPRSGWALEMCGGAYVINGTNYDQYACPSPGCIATGTKPPQIYDSTPTTCQWSRDGLFSNGKLLVNCGSSSVYTNSSGTVTTNTSFSYASVTLYQ